MAWNYWKFNGKRKIPNSDPCIRKEVRAKLFVLSRLKEGKFLFHVKHWADIISNEPCKPISLVLIERKSFVPGIRARTITGSTYSQVQPPVMLHWELFWPNRLCVSRMNGLVRKTLNNNDVNQVADQQFSLKQWFASGAHSCRLKNTGSAHCYLRIFPSAHEQFSHFELTP